MQISVHPVQQASVLTIAAGAKMRVVVGPQTGARHRTMHVIELEAGASTPVWRHADSEAAYYVVSGSGAVWDLERNQRHAVQARSMWYVSPGTPYRIEADRDGPLVCAGGPCPADPAVYVPAR